MNKFNILSSVTLLALGSILVACPGNGSDDLGGIDEQTNTVVAGVLKDFKGRPVVSARVDAFRAETKESLFDITDENGKFRIYPEKKGLYGLSSSKDNLAMYKVIDFDGKEMNIETTLDSVFDVTSVVVGDKDRPSEETYVSLPGSKWDAHTDSKGYFTFKSVPKGLYPIIVKPLDKQYVNSYYVVSVSGEKPVFYGPYPEKIITSVLEQIENGTFKKENGSSKIQLVHSSDFGSVSSWNFDDVQESKSVMSSRDNKLHTDNIVFYGKPSVESGIQKKAVAFSGASQYGIIENDNDILTDVSTITLDVWVMIKKTPKGDSYRRNIVGKLGFGSSSDQDVFSLAIIQGACESAKPRFAFFLASGEESDSLKCSEAVFSKDIETKKWSYISVVWTDSILTLYVNGRKVDKMKTSVKKIAPSAEPIIFGKEELNIILDDVQIGTKAINETDVLFRYYSKGGVL